MMVNKNYITKQIYETHLDELVEVIKKMQSELLFLKSKDRARNDTKKLKNATLYHINKGDRRYKQLARKALQGAINAERSTPKSYIEDNEMDKLLHGNLAGVVEKKKDKKDPPSFKEFTYQQKEELKKQEKKHKKEKEIEGIIKKILNE